MRILFYNWVDYRDPAGRGGGVSLYQQMLMEGMAARDDVEATFLCAGLAHTLRGAAPRWEAIGHGPEAERGRRFTLVDSAPLSPSHHSFGQPEQVDHPPTVAAFADFVDGHGPFDVIHFNNLEGLPARVLELRARWPRTRFVLSLHNYYPFCPQVNLWQRERAHCDDDAAGRACATCLPFRPDPRSVRRAHAVAHAFDRVGIRPGTAAHDRALRPAMRAAARAVRSVAARRRGGGGADAAATDTRTAPLADGAPFRHRRAEMVRLIGRHCDRVLAVSERTADIARDFGLPRERVTVLPIGTDHADRWQATTPPDRLPADNGTLSLAFLGYMRRDKGFYFLLDALEALPEDVLGRLRILVAAATREAESAARLQRLGARCRSLRHVEGYERDDLDRLLTGVDLGVVPVLWEDNLPQVALEMHARRIPLLTSDRGGARELGRTPELVFRAGDAASFAARLTSILDAGIALEGYWRRARPPITPADHLDRLIAVYRGL